MQLIQKEAFTVRYWLHIALVSIIVLGILQFLFGQNMFNVKNILYSIPIIGIADVITHATFSKLGYPT